MPTVGTTHSVKLGTKYLMLRPGSYMRKPAPTFGPRFTGGDPDFNNLSIWQHWAQHTWVGGMDAPLWTDDAMYDDGVGVTTWMPEKMTLTRDLLRGASGWGLASGKRRFIVYNGNLYCVQQMGVSTSRLYGYTVATDTWAAITAFAANFACHSITTFDGKLYAGGILSGTPKLYYGSGALGSWTLVANPAGVTEAITSMRNFGGKVYVAYGKQIWRGKDDQTWDGSTVFYKAGMNSDSNYITSMETHLGFLYFLSQNGHIHRTDGNNTFDIWSWDGGTYGVALRSYDGKLFVATYEFTTTADVGFGVLYQFTGSAVTQLKRWGKIDQSTSLGSLTVYDRKLFYGASNLLGMTAGFGVAVYDAIEDSHSIFASNRDTVTYAPGSSPFTNNTVDDVFFFNGYMFVSVRGHGLFKTPFAGVLRDEGGRSVIVVGRLSHDVTAAGGSAIPLNGGWFTTSTYDAGTPGLKKLWRRLSVDAMIPASCHLILEYSPDDGLNWTAYPAISYSNGLRQHYNVFINNVKSTSLKLRFTLRSTTGGSTPSLFGFNVSYLMIPEPNWQWTFTAVIGEKVVQMDGVSEVVDTEATIAYFSTLWRTQSLVDFIDLNGTAWATNGPGVLIYDMQVRVFNTTRPYEAEIMFSLVEAVETY